MWGLREGEDKNLVRKIHNNQINDFSFSSDRNIIFTISLDRTVKALDLNFTVLHSVIIPENDIPSRIFNLDGILISGGNFPNIYFFAWEFR